MNILIASDSYKGCMSSAQANLQIESGLKRADPGVQTETFEVSDGGEGMVKAFVKAAGAELKTAPCADLYGRKIMAEYGYDPRTKTACIEAASCLGLTLYPREKRRPLETSSYGLGLLLKEVLKEDVQNIIIGLGGTGSNDGGMGLLEAFGAVFYNRHRKKIHASTGTLGQIAFIDKSHFHFPGQIHLTAACDVSSPLLGPEGATFVFGKQKGLSRTDQIRVENGMKHAADKIEQTFHVDTRLIPGAGAAGGLGSVLIGVFEAQMESGLDVLAKAGRFDEMLKKADLLITGEGQSDQQTLYGKAVFALAQKAEKMKIPVICLSGALGVGYEQLYNHGICGIFSTADRAMSFPTAIALGPQKLEQAAFSLMKMIDGLAPVYRKENCPRN